jgi:hypothetical protein
MSQSVQAVAGTSVRTLPTQLNCAHCGIPFTPRRRRSDGRFCRASCRARWHQAKQMALFNKLDDAISRAAMLLSELRSIRKLRF